MANGLVKGHGNWVDGERFFNRQSDVQILSECIQEGGHRSLTAQRRMGKTSLARELCRRLDESKSIYPLFTDIENADCAEDVIKILLVEAKPLKSIWKKSLGLFRNFLEVGNGSEISVGDVGLKIRLGLSDGNWQEKGDAFFQILASQDRPVLLVIDELSIFINRILKVGASQITLEGKRGADIFLSWLRKNAQQHRGRVSIIISGSIGLEPILKQAGLSASINAFPAYELQPWDEQTVMECLTALASRYRVTLEANVGKKVYERLGIGIPHYVQSFFDLLHADAQRHNRSIITEMDVDRVYN